MSEFEYNLDRINNASAACKINGVIDPSTVEQFGEAMGALLKFGDDNNCKTLVVNLAELTYINSSGLRVILTTSKTAKAKNIALRFVDAIEDVYKVFEQVGYCRIFDIRKLSG